MSILRTIVSSSRALITTAKDATRFREIGRVFISQGFGWAVAKLKLRRELQVENADDPHTKTAQNGPETGKRLVAAFTKLGPTWVKFGQILSTRSDALPSDLLRELSTLQASVTPEPFEAIDAQLRRHLGEDYRRHFDTLDEKSLASASIGQVHRARLTSGEEVVLKIQRPGIRPIIESDIHILLAVAGYVEEAFKEASSMDLRGMVRDFAKSLSQELDYRAEAANMERFRRNFSGHDTIRIPKVFESLSSSEVLVMEYLDGRTFHEVLADGEDIQEAVRSYFGIAYKMLFLDGFFHGDLHPGNVLVMDDGRLGILDCGMVGRLSPNRKDKVIDILYAVINEDLEGVARTVYALAIPETRVDYPAFEADTISIAERYLVGVPMSQIHIGELFGELVAGAAKHNIRMPTDFTMMFKAILTTEGLAKTIAPDVDPVELARPYITQMVSERYSPDRLKQTALHDFQLLSEFARSLPTALPNLMDGLQSGRLAIGLGDETLSAQKKAADLRTGRTIRASFAVVFWICGTLSLLVPGLPILAWGISYISAIFWGFAAFWSFTLLRRGGLV